MHFRIRKASGDEPPCDDAVMQPTVLVDLRMVDDPMKIAYSKESGVDWWYGYGQNHRVEDGKIMRDIAIHSWVVEIPSLEALLTFIEKCGTIVVYGGSGFGDYPEIIIYDDYLE